MGKRVKVPTVNVDHKEAIAGVIFDHDYDEELECRPLECSCHDIATKILELMGPFVAYWGD